jgi:Glycogen recognition site of AMP-activated protein kinase
MPDSAGESRRNITKQQYANIRRSLAAFEEDVIARYWDENTLIRVSYRRFLGSLDQFVGWLVTDDEMSRRGQLAIERGDRPAAADEQETPSSSAPDVPEQEDKQPLPAEAGTPVTASTVDVTFTLPAEVQAESVALCGEFNQWSPDDIRLERDGGGTWRTTVALEPGRTYRYRYLLDGERWENAPQADGYLPNPYGSVDSVVIVAPNPQS